MKTNITYVTAVIAHLAIGYVIYLNESLAKLYFFIAFFYFLYRIITVVDVLKTYEILKACAYFVGAEVFLRTTRGNISYESGKYIVILFVLIGMFQKGVSGKAYPYFMYLMFLIPSIFVASTTLSFDANFRTNIAFVLSGPVCLGLTALFCYEKPISFKQLSQILLFMVLPIIAHTVYIYFYAPNLRDILYSTASNRAAAGGFGSNQVATVLGLGMFIMSIRIFVNSNSMGVKLLNLAILIFMSYRAVATLSRGGVIAAIICIAVFLVMFFYDAKARVKNNIIGIFVLFLGALVLAWFVSVDQTKGLAEKRYANQNAKGIQKDDITTGRGELFMMELEGFISNPFFGIGSSRAKDQRIELEGQGITSHNELSRILAEHGFFGVLILLILLFKPLDFRFSNRRNYYFYAFLAFWFATINHSSMRIAAPAFMYGLALLTIVNEKRPLHRKQLKAGAE